MTNPESIQNIRNRLKEDTGKSLQFIKIIDTIPIIHWSPFWLIARSLFPIAESIGDLIYNNTSTIKNLIDLFENELAAINTSYENCSHIVPQLFRHSLPILMSYEL